MEVMVAMSVIAIGFGVILQITGTILSGSALSGRYTEATILAQNKLEEVLQTGVADQNGGEFPDQPGYKWNVTTSEGPVPGLKKLAVSVSFRAPGGERSVELDSFLADTRK